MVAIRRWSLAGLILDMIKLGYKDHGYNEFTVIKKYKFISLQRIKFVEFRGSKWLVYYISLHEQILTIL